MISKDKKTIVLLNRPERHFVGSFYFKNIKSGIDFALEGSNYQVFFAQQDDHFEEILSSKKQKIAGVISIHPTINDKSIKLLEKETDIDSILINCRSDKISWVDLDNICGAMTMTEHLIKLGHEKILFLGGFFDSQNSIVRFEGYKKALEKYHIKYDPKLTLSCDFGITVSYDRMKEYLSSNSKSFTAIFAANDLMAVGAIRALADNKIKVPEDIAVVGFDDFEFASTFYIPLTTYKQPFHNLGYIAAKTILRSIETKNKCCHQVELIGDLIVRKSCGAAK